MAESETAAELTAHVARLCKRVEAVDLWLRALAPEPDRRDRLLAAAAALAARFPDPTAQPPLFGAAVGVKDIIHVAGLVTRAGSALPPEELQGEQGGAVDRLLAAGALILGKTASTEFAYFEPGLTVNPHNPAHTPGGSSSGSAAAVAAGLALLALGTQTVGSVIRPAAFCGVVGFKPTYDRIPTSGLLYFAPSVDHMGLFAPDLATMASAAAVLCEAWQPPPAGRLPVLGLPDGAYLAQAGEEARSHLTEHVARLQEAGCHVVRTAFLADIDDINRQHRLLIAHEFAQQQARLFAQYAWLYRPRTAALIREGQGIGIAEADAIRKEMAQRRGAVQEMMAATGVDLWLSPAATGPAPAGLDSTGDPVMNLPWTYLGLPTLTLPAGRAANGLPLGLQIAAGWMEDEHLLAWAEELQGASHFERTCASSVTHPGA